MFLFLFCFEILTKFNKKGHFPKVTLENFINAIAANIIMFCVRYSPYALIEEHYLCSTFVNEYFYVELLDPNISFSRIPAIKNALGDTGFSQAERIIAGKGMGH